MQSFAKISNYDCIISSMDELYEQECAEKLTTEHAGDDGVENELLVGDEFVRAEGGDGLQEERGRTFEVAHGHLVQTFIRAKTILALPVAALEQIAEY